MRMVLDGEALVEVELVPAGSVSMSAQYGQTPLMMAGSKNSVDVVLQLLDRGADHTVLDNVSGERVPARQTNVSWHRGTQVCTAMALRAGARP